MIEISNINLYDSLPTDVIKTATLPLNEFSWNTAHNSLTDISAFSIGDISLYTKWLANRDSNSRMWDLHLINKYLLLAEEFATDTSHAPNWRSLPVAVFYNYGWNVSMSGDSDLDIEPGDMRIQWAKLWGYQKSKFIIIDTINRFVNENLLTKQEILNNNDIWYFDKQSKAMFSANNADIISYSQTGLDRLKHSYFEESIFHITLKKDFTNEQQMMIKALADSRYDMVFGNGWKITNPNGPNNKSSKYYNFPQQHLNE